MSGLGELIELDAYRHLDDDDPDPPPPAALGRVRAEEGVLDALERADRRLDALAA